MAKVIAAAALILISACNGTPGFRAEDGEVFDAVLPAYPLNMNIAGRDMRLLAYTLPHKEPIELRPAFVVPSSVLRDFMDRNAVRHSLAQYHPRQLHLERTDKPETPVLSLTLPGYSSDHNEALVEVSITTSGLSGGGELLHLKKSGGQWRVIGRQRTWIS